METTRSTSTPLRRIPPGGDEPEPRGELADLVRKHQGMVWRYLRLLGADENEADDLLQEAFLRVARVLREGETLHKPAGFLRVTARNLLIGARRRERLRTPTAEWAAAVDDLVAEDPNALEDARIEALRACRANLRNKARLVVELYYIDGHSYRESARKLGLTVNGVKALIRRARHALRACIDRHLQGDQES